MPPIIDLIITTAIATAGLTAFFCDGHSGLILTMSAVSGVWMISDLLKLYAAYKGKEPEVLQISLSQPVRPKLPVQWFALSLILQSAGLLMQLVVGFTVIAGMCMAVFIGCEIVLHLWYYSRSVAENAITLLPTLAFSGVVLAFVLTGEAQGYGYIGLGRWGGIFWVLVAAFAGMVFGKFFLDWYGVYAEDGLDERQPLKDQPRQKAIKEGDV
eukprot:gb/GFBE01055839.1/.p1 GENE.gb/GFBE01055839.1/~~gb/GFBE01055839.1/.p1  ORF type:complete len:213 (+),score=42.07 gb/GFBE01055839.1/:1-639(+)